MDFKVRFLHFRVKNAKPRRKMENVWLKDNRRQLNTNFIVNLLKIMTSFHGIFESCGGVSVRKSRIIDDMRKRTNFAIISKTICWFSLMLLSFFFIYWANSNSAWMKNGWIPWDLSIYQAPKLCLIHFWFHYDVIYSLFSYSSENFNTKSQIIKKISISFLFYFFWFFFYALTELMFYSYTNLQFLSFVNCRIFCCSCFFF